MGTGHQLLAGRNTFRSNDVTTLAVSILDQCNMGTAVRIVFDTLNNGWNAILVATEIDDAIMLLVATTDMTGSDATVVVTTTGLGLLFKQRRIRSTLVQLLVDH